MLTYTYQIALHARNILNILDQNNFSILHPDFTFPIPSTLMYLSSAYLIFVLFLESNQPIIICFQLDDLRSQCPYTTSLSNTHHQIQKPLITQVHHHNLLWLCLLLMISFSCLTNSQQQSDQTYYNINIESSSCQTSYFPSDAFSH